MPADAGGGLHAIEARLVDDELEPASATNFRLCPGEPVDADRAVTEAGWSLYCLDVPAGQALFLDIGPDVDLAQSAFVNVTQFRLARRALLVPFDALPHLAAAVPPPQHLILVFSIGRCGTTLVNAMMNEVEGVWALSEPDSSFDLVMRRASLAPEAVERLLVPCIRLLFRPPAGRSATTLAVKFRSQDLFHADRFHAAFPDAAYVFMYREGTRWARSFWHMLAKFGLPPTLDRDARRDLWWILSANTDPAMLHGLVVMEAEAVFPEELLAATWALSFAEYRRLRAVGVPFMPLRYDELDADREPVTARLLRHCGLPLTQVPAALRAFARDSQAGTRIGRDHRVASFGPENLARFRATLARCPGAVSTDAILPD